MEKRKQLKLRSVKEKEELEERNRKEELQSAHDIWVSWYETSIYEAKQKRREAYDEKKSEKERLQAEEDQRRQEMKEQGLDVKSWTKSKLLAKRRETREARQQFKIQAQSQPTALQKIKTNDKAFRDWVKRVNKREREEQEMEKIRRKLRNIEMRKEMRAQKALQSIRAAQEEAMSFKNFVF